MKNIKYILGILVFGLYSCEKEPLETNEKENTGETVEFNLRKGNSNSSHKVDVCHTNAKMLNIDYHGAYSHLEHGDILFSCNPTDGVQLSDIKSDLEAKVIADGGDVTNKNDMKKAFENWYTNDYLTGTWSPEEPSTGTSSGGNGSGGLGGGSL